MNMLPASSLRIAVSLAAFTASGAVSAAAVLLANPFAHPDGPLSRAPGWYAATPNIGHPSDGDDHLLVRGGALLWDGARSSVNAIVCHRIVPPGRNLPALVFIGFVLQVESTPARPRAAANGAIGTTLLTLTTESGRGQRAQLGIVAGEMEGCFRLSFGQSSGITDADVLPREFMAGKDVRVVIAYDSARHVGSIWVNPSGREDEPALHSTAPATSARLQSIGVRMHNRGEEDMGALRISRMVVATTFAEAMPAP